MFTFVASSAQKVMLGRQNVIYFIDKNNKKIYFLPLLWKWRGKTSKEKLWIWPGEGFVYSPFLHNPIWIKLLFVIEVQDKKNIFPAIFIHIFLLQRFSPIDFYGWVFLCLLCIHCFMLHEYYTLYTYKMKYMYNIMCWIKKWGEKYRYYYLSSIW